MSEHDGVLRHTLSDGHPVHRHLRDAVEVDERRRDHEHVEYLVTLELNGHIFSGTDTSRTVLRGAEGPPGVWGVWNGKGGPGNVFKI